MDDKKAPQPKRSMFRANIQIGGLKKASPADIALLTRQLATLLDAGLPLVRGLRILMQQQSERHQLRNVLRDVIASVEGGKTFSDALGKFPKTFDNLFVNMIRAGEAGGVLEVVLNRLAEFSEKAQKLKRRVKSAMTYPAVVLGIAAVVVFFLLTFVIPRFQTMFEGGGPGGGSQMPLITQILIDLAAAVKGFFLLTRPLMTIGVIAVIILAIFLWKAFLRTAAGRFSVDAFVIRAPVFGILVRKVIIARFTRTLGTLLQSGVPILQALDIVRDAVGNSLVARAIGKVHNSIKEGESVVGPLRDSNIFDPMVIGMIDVGEETGTLAAMMLRVADTYDDEVDTAVEGLTSLLEPFLIVFLAIIVGTIVIAMFLPLLKVMQGMSANSGGM